MSQIILWTIIAIAALLIDILSTSFFLSGFTIGGIFAIVTKILGANFTAQIIVFIIVSMIAICAEYLWFRKKLKSTIPKTLKMEEEYIGMTDIAEDDIDKKGKIKVGGIYWTAENIGEKVYKGDQYTITAIKGNKLIIKK